MHMSLPTWYLQCALTLFLIGSAFAVVYDDTAFASMDDSSVAIPDQVTGLTATASNNTISLSWDTSDGNDTTGYVIQRSVVSDVWYTISDLYNTSSYLDTHLRGVTEYSYRIAAISNAGTGMYSDTASATTDATIPDIIRHLSVYGSNEPFTLIVSWSAPFDGGDPITGYNLLRSVDGGSWTMILGSYNDTSYLDTDLDPKIPYSYRVAAINDVGTGVYGNNITNYAYDVPGQVTGLDVVSTNNNNDFALSWDTPNSGGTPLLSYSIQRSVVVVAADGSWVTLSDSSDDESYVDSDITNGVSYTYRVAAISHVGQGTYSSNVTITHTTLEPDKVSKFNVIQTDQIITLSWVAPVNDGGSPITGYTIQRSVVVAADGSWVTLSDFFDDTSYVDTELDVGVTYTYRIAAINNVGTGEYSDSVSSVFSAFEPKRITKVNATISGNTTTLSWNAPYDGNSPITGYVIQRSVDDAPWAIIESSYHDTSYVDSNLSRTVLYAYRIAAINNIGTGAYSGSAQVYIHMTTTSQITGLGAVALGNTITLSWDAPIDDGGSIPTGYVIQRSMAGDSWVTISKYDASRVYVDSHLTPGTTYTYRVAASNGMGTSVYSANATGITGSVYLPNAITGLDITSSGNTASLSWNAAVHNGSNNDIFTSYIIQRSESSSSWVTISKPHYSTSYTDLDLTPGVTYTYRIAATNIIGTGAYSVNATTTILTTPGEIIRLVAIPADYSIGLYWQDGHDGGNPILGYTIQYSESGNPWVDITSPTFDTTTISFTHNDLNPSTTYTYRVAAFSAVGHGPFSYNVSAIVIDPLAVPDQVTGLSAVAINATTVSLSWDAPINDGGSSSSPITGYIIQRSVGNIPWSVIESSHKDTSYMDSGLTAATTYTYRVAATNDVGIGVYSLNAVITLDVATSLKTFDFVSTDIKTYCDDMTISELIASGNYNVIDKRDSSLSSIKGTGNNDLILLGDNAPSVTGHGGDDCIIGGSGNDEITGGNGNDTIYGNDGNDEITGGNGNDTIYGNGGDDNIFGKKGNDLIYGDAGRDFLRGNAGDDILHGDLVDLKVFGGKNNDTCYGPTGTEFRACEVMKP